MRGTLVVAFAIVIAACGGKNTKSYTNTPGEEKPAKEKALEAGADLMQDKTPLKAFNSYLNGFHFYNGNIAAQMEAHHYVSQLNKDLYQAVIFDGNGPDAKLMGIEYIVSEEMFAQLPADEKRFWHSHSYEVKSGELIAPGIPEVAEHELMEKIVRTYGKLIHTWHTDQERNLPVGIPMIMIGFTKDGQIKKDLLTARDKRFEVSTEEKRNQRGDIPMPGILPGANAWERGEVWQLTLTNKPDSAKHKH